MGELKEQYCREGEFLGSSYDTISLLEQVELDIDPRLWVVSIYSKA